MDILYKKVRANLNNLVNKPARILIALSGGRDSITLLNVLLELKDEYDLSLLCAYVNHNLRENESDEEEGFIKRYTDEKQVQTFIERIDKAYWETIKSESIEMAARRNRYDFFNRIADTENIDFIATAHNFNDRIETFFLSLFRAGGIDTLTSIPMKNKNVIRPLLNVTRDEINEYIIGHNIPYIEDSTNRENVYKRNIIRNKILPLFKEVHPDFEKSFTHIFHFVNEEHEFIDFSVDHYYHDVLIGEYPGKICLDMKIYQSFPIVIRKYLVKLILKKLNYPAPPAMSLFQAVTGDSKRYVYQKHRLCVISCGKKLWFVNTRMKLFVPGLLMIQELPYTFETALMTLSFTRGKGRDPVQNFCLKYTEDMFPLNIRPVTEDDTIKLPGNATKHIIGILKEMGVPSVLYKEAIVIKTAADETAGFIIFNQYRTSGDFYIDDNNDEQIIITYKCICE